MDKTEQVQFYIKKKTVKVAETLSTIEVNLSCKKRFRDSSVVISV